MSRVALLIDRGSTFKALVVSTGETVGQLYQLVSKLMNANVDEFYLVHGERMQDMNKKINTYGFLNNDRITFCERNHGGSGLRPLPGYIQLTDEPCCLTGDEEPSEKRAKMPCGCAIGTDAVQLQAKSTLDRGDCNFNCPNCGSAWEFSLVKHVLSASLNDDELKATSSKATTNYVQKRENDIRQCGLCKAFGMRDFTKQWYANRDRVRCNNCSREKGRNVDICWICGLEWKGSSWCGNEICAKMKRERLETLASCGTKTIGSVAGCPETRACPKCGTFISHVDKCKHMDCKCGYSFCFICLKPKDAKGGYQCGSWNSPCIPAPRQTTLPQ